MKKIIKRTLIALGILLLLLVLLAGGYWLKMRSEIKKMNPCATGEMVFGNDTLYSIKDTFVNMFLVRSMGEYFAFDAGNDTEIIKGELGKLGIGPDKVTAIFLTHTDGDHVAAIRLFRNARLYFSVAEEPLTTGKKKRFLFFGTKIPAMEYTLLSDNQAVTERNDTIRCISTPGHSPGSMSYLVNGKYLFTGDALAIRNGRVEEFNPFFCWDLDVLRESLGKLARIDSPEYLFTAHYGITADCKFAFSGWSK
jgi:hydroxyacylglutathione hydrolase